MYLRAERHVRGDDYRDEEERQLYQGIISILGIPGAEWAQSGTVKGTVGYWRKANQIHAWFVRNVQGGEDECRPFTVSREQLQVLRDLCKLLLDERELVIASGGDEAAIADRANELLPPQDGFFFGDFNINEWYWQNLQATVEQIDVALQAPACVYFEYQSSW